MTTILLTALVFVGITAAVAFAGMKLWIRPKEAMERVTGVGVDMSEVASTAHPSLAFRDMLQRLGTMLPASPKDVSVMQKRLIRAGIRNQNAIKILYGAKLVFGVAVPLVVTTFLLNSNMESSQKIMTVLASGIAGFFGPNEYVKWRGRKRQHQVQRALPNALDLLVVCVESGLGLDQAIVQVSKELEHAHPEISEELAFVNLEMKAGKRRIESLRNLAERTNVDDLKKLVAVLIQADRFGTSVAQSLRGHAEFMRIKARQVAEEKAAKLGVKLVFPIFFCILPTLFVVTVGPMAVKIMRDLAPMFKAQ
jgi:tight adherence protein C